MTEQDLMVKKHSQVITDPYPNLSFAKAHLWGVLDHWAWKRMRRLGFPSPWAAWKTGYDQAYAEMSRARNDDKLSGHDL